MNSGQWDGIDRRSQPTPLFSKYTLLGKRRAHQRDGVAQSNYHVDRPEAVYLGLLMIIVLLVIFDAVVTWIFLAHGGEEGNPFVLWTLSLGPWTFWAIKLLPLPLMLTYFAVKRFFLWARLLAYLLLIVYTALACFHIYGIFTTILS